MHYDYIIVGGGSAGCILADRLSADGQYSVLLLEAGERDDGFWFRIPVGFARLYYNQRFNWMYDSEPQSTLDGRRLYVPRGKVLGGSGAINAMIYVRGQPRDFDDWAAAGNPGWSYEDVLPYFRRLETHPSTDDQQHGRTGPIHITPMKNAVHPIVRHFLQGCAQAGLPACDDFNAGAAEGAGIYDINARDGERCSSSRAYLRPAMQRPNLEVRTRCQVQSITWDALGCRANGVVALHGGQQVRLHAVREVILCAGAVDSPRLLQLSGIGDPATLARHGIPLTRAMPAVGRHLQDHLCASFYYKSTVPTLNDQLGNRWGQLRLGLQYLLRRSGPLSMSVNQAGGFFRGTASATHPNLQLYFNPLSYQIPRDGGTLKPEPYPGFLLCFNPCRPNSRGEIRLASADPSQPALIDPNYLSTDHDVDEVLQGCRLIRRLMDTPALRAINAREVLPGVETRTDEQMLDYFRANCGSIYHLSGSCAMGPDPATSVVDARLRVHGLQGLRVVDASIFPNVTSGNTQAATFMVAEKGADMILADARNG